MRRVAPILTIYLAWLFAWYLPAHTRGQFTMGPREASTCTPGGSGAEAAGPAVDCCGNPISPDAGGSSDPDHKPTPGDRARCAVCYFAVGLMPVISEGFYLPMLERLEPALSTGQGQCARPTPIREATGRDPPSALRPA